MHALVVFESMFGNTQAVAGAIADGLASHMTVDVVDVGSAPTTVGDAVDLLVVGGPTHAFGLSRGRTRADAARRAGPRLVPTGIGLREWLAAVRNGSPDIAAVAFDTRIGSPRVPGSAARAARRRLRRLGFRIIRPAESFYVEGTPGPLLNGETDRAQRWGETLASALTGQRTSESTTR
jgi:hypothetical protein